MPVASDFGLAVQGGVSATRDFQDLETGRQRVETGRMGLEDLSRTRDTAAAVRGAATAGASRGQDMGGTFEDMALAAEQKGDVQQALQFRQAKKALEDEGIKNVVHKALIDPTPGKRPDLAAEFNRYGKSRDMPDDVELDEKGNLWATNPKTGQRGSINIGKTAERLGMVKPFEKEIPAGGMYVRGNPATGETTTIRNDALPKFELKDGILYNERSGSYQQVDTSGKWTLGKITHGNQEVPVAVNSSTGAVNLLGPGGVRTGLDAHVTAPTMPGGPTVVTMPGGAVSVFTPGTEGAPGKTNVFSANTPPTPATPPKLTPVVTDTPPVEGAQKAPDGKWYVRSGNGYAEVIVSGAPPAAGAAPKPAAAAAPKPAPAPAPAAAPVKAEEDRIPEVSESPAPGLSPAARHQSRVSAARGEQDKVREMAPKKRAVETFRSIAASPRMTAEDAPLIKEAIDTGLLTPAEKSKAERMLAKLQPQTAGYAEGGVIQKVSHGIEAVGKALGTERGKVIEKADRALAKEKEKPPSPLERAKTIESQIDKAEGGYASDGRVSRYGL